MAQPDCPHCGGTGWKTVERIAEDEKPKRVSGRSPSRTRRKETRLGRPLRLHGSDRAARTMARARIPRRYEHCDFDSFYTGLYQANRDPPIGARSRAWNRSLEQSKLVRRVCPRFSGWDETGLLLMGTCRRGARRIWPSPHFAKSFARTTGLFYDYR